MLQPLHTALSTRSSWPVATSIIDSEHAVRSGRMPRKVLYVDQTGQLGGGELSLLDIVSQSRSGAEVVLFTDGPFRDALEDLSVPVHVIAAGSAANVRRKAGAMSLVTALPALLKLQRELGNLAEGFDAVYANSQKAFLVSALAHSKDRLLIWHLRDMLTADHFSPVLRKVAIAFGNHFASLVIANSQATAASFVEAGGRPDKVEVVHNGISAEPFDLIEEETINSKRSLLCLDGKFAVGVFGRFSPWKGQHVLLEAVALLPDVHAVLVGDALFGEDAYAQKLHERARAPDLAGRVHFLGFQRDVCLLMKCVDVVAHTSIAPEPFGRVVVEGMLAGRPVIAARAGGVPEIITHNETGLLVSAGSAEELSASIRRLQLLPELAERLTVAARKRALEHFSRGAMVRGIERVIAMKFGGPNTVKH